MGGLMGGGSPPPIKMPKPPKLPPTPRMATETDPDIERRARMARNARRKGQRANYLSELTSGKIQKQSLGGSGGNANPGISKG
jgi:hypothetical protein